MHEKLTADDLRFAPPDLPDAMLASFLKQQWGIEGHLKRLSGERDQNLRVRTPDGTQYVYKIASSIELPELVDFQVRALLHLEKADPELPVPRLHRSKRGNAVETLTDSVGNEHLVRLLSYVPGVPLGSRGTPALETITQIGALQGRMCKEFTGFHHPAEKHFMPWDILNDLVVSRILRTDYLTDGLAEACAPMLDRLAHDTLPRMHKLPQQIIHNDAHSGNVMVDPDNPSRVTGVIDFGDLVCRPIVVDLSTSLASLMERCPAPIPAAAALVLGFEKHLRVPDEQRELLYDAVLARAIMTVELLEFRVRNTAADAETRDVMLPGSKAGLWKILEIDDSRFLDAVRQPARALRDDRDRTRAMKR